MELLSGGEMLVRFLRDEGVDYIYGYPGGALLHVYWRLFAIRICVSLTRRLPLNVIQSPHRSLYFLSPSRIVQFLVSGCAIEANTHAVSRFFLAFSCA